MNDIINIQGLPLEAKESIVNFYEFIKEKYARTRGKKSNSRKNLLNLMEKGIYKLPKDFTFNRDQRVSRS